MSNYYAPQPPAYGGGGGGAQNLNFYESNYAAAPGAGQQAGYGFGAQQGAAFGAAPSPGFNGGFGAPGGGVSGRMGEQGGLRTGWIAAFSTEGYEGEPPLLTELGIDFSHVGQKVLLSCSLSFVDIPR